MSKRLINSLIISCLIVSYANGQSIKEKIKFAPEVQMLFGGEITSPFDFLIGGRLQYDLNNFKNTNFKDAGLNLSVGFNTDIGKIESKLMTYDAQLGITLRKSKVISPFASIGGHYVKESHVVSLIEGNRTWNSTKIGLTSSAGINFRINKHITPAVFVRYSQNAFATTGIKLNISL